MNLTDDEHEVVTNIWGDDTPTDLRDLDSDQLLEMQIKVARAVGVSIQDGDYESLSILEPLEEKVETVLASRL